MEDTPEVVGWVDIDDKLKKLRERESVLGEAKMQVDELRREICDTIRAAGGNTFHGEEATVSLVHRKVVMIEDTKRQMLIDGLRSVNQIKYVTLIPEHYELSPTFMDHVKSGFLQADGVEVKETISIQVRYVNKVVEEKTGE